MTVIFKCLSGSRLYGTNAAASDWDYRGVHLPTPDEILLGTIKENIRHTPCTQTANTQDDVDFDTYSVGKFLRLVEKGQPIAVEMLFTEPLDGLNTSAWTLITEAGKRLINSRLPGMMGFSSSVANMKYESAGGRKNLYHAIRVNSEMVELHETGKLTFPLAGADILVKYKSEEVWNIRTFDTMCHMHQITFKDVMEAKENSVLPEQGATSADEEILKIHRKIVGIA